MSNSCAKMVPRPPAVARGYRQSVPLLIDPVHISGNFCLTFDFMLLYCLCFARVSAQGSCSEELFELKGLLQVFSSTL